MTSIPDFNRLINCLNLDVIFFVDFRSFSHDKYITNTVNDKSIDSGLRTRTQSSRMVAADESTELWRHPVDVIFLAFKKQKNQVEHYEFPGQKGGGDLANLRVETTYLVILCKQLGGTTNQCDQMARLFFKVSPFLQTKFAYYHKNVAKVGSKQCQILNQPLKTPKIFDVLHKVAKFRQIWSHCNPNARETITETQEQIQTRIKRDLLNQRRTGRNAFQIIGGGGQTGKGNFQSCGQTCT